MTKRKAKKIKLPRSVKRLFPNVTSAYDSNTPIEVSVNKKDCADAKKFDPAQCAMAKAAKRELHADGAIIGISSSYIIKGKKAIRFATPESVRREIVSFDRHNDFEPGEYYLTPKAPSNRLGTVHSRGDGSGGGHKSKRKIHKSVRVRMLAKS